MGLNVVNGRPKFVDNSSSAEISQIYHNRAEIRTLDPLVLRAEYESRAQDPSGKYDDWLKAVEEAPGGGLLPGEVLDRGKESRLLRSMDPDVRQKITDLTELRNAQEHFIRLVERELPAPDPIAELAGSAEGESY